MKVDGFRIKNFKGINDLTLDFRKSPNSNIYTLIGLNESGKTTVLEAINYFTYKDEELEPLNIKNYQIEDIHDLIPISKRSNFTDEISIETKLRLDKEDNEFIKEELRKEQGFIMSNNIEQIQVNQRYIFKDSKFVESKTGWSNCIFHGKTNRQKKERNLEGEAWRSATNIVKKLMPNILYFPTTLFDFPDRIYLEDREDVKDNGKHKFYRSVIQDVLDNLNNGLHIDTHILDRMKTNEENDKNHLEQVLRELSTKIEQVVFDAWKEVFKSNDQNYNVNNVQKRIRITYGKDEEEKCYLEFFIEDSDGNYKISERSLGFRWFFVFFMLTQFRGFRKSENREIIFLFDEPASSLHQTAQQRLLKSLGTIGEKCSIIYTTHSQHLVNPDWLEGTYVVKNEGLDDEKFEEYNSRKTDIKIYKYREFASKYPNKISYFQIVLDILEYVPSKLEYIPDVVMLEGKNDFYTIKYFKDVILKDRSEINLLPGLSSGSLDNLISLYIGWGKNFMVLVDSDQEGSIQKERYIEKFGTLIEDRIFTYEDINIKWKNLAIEKIIGETECLGIQLDAYPESNEFDKKVFNRSIQEKLIKQEVNEFSKETIDKFNTIIGFLKDHF
ncbi:MAG: hypothetical protein E7310_04720 [Clostridiales bacterium]|nr:hypothetical protein [Clostridiales bacterium]